MFEDKNNYAAWYKQGITTQTYQLNKRLDIIVKTLLNYYR